MAPTALTVFTGSQESPVALCSINLEAKQGRVGVGLPASKNCRLLFLLLLLLFGMMVFLIFVCVSWLINMIELMRVLFESFFLSSLNYSFMNSGQYRRQDVGIAGSRSGYGCFWFPGNVARKLSEEVRSPAFLLGGFSWMKGFDSTTSGPDDSRLSFTELISFRTSHLADISLKSLVVSRCPW